MISYVIYDERCDQLQLHGGFFQGWPNPPNEERHRSILRNSYRSIVAVDSGSHEIIGFVNAISDGILSAYIPLLEVVPSYQGRGIGAELVRRMLDELKDFYMIDLCCDQSLVSFYEKLGMQRTQGMIRRNYQYQSGRER